MQGSRANVNPTVHLNRERYEGSDVPAQITRQLKEKYSQGKLRSLALAAEFVRLQALCASHEISILPLKGPVLSQELFGDIGLRTSGDLDILIPYERVEAADQLVQAQGYQRKSPVRALTPRQRRAFTVLNQHNSYFHPEKRIVLEVHWSLANAYLLPLTATTEVMTRARTVERFGAQLTLLSLEDTFIYLLLHGAKHNWARFKWVLDIDAFTRNQVPVDWERMMALVKAQNLQRPLAQGLLLVQRALGTCIPESARLLVNAEPGGLALAGSAWRALTANEDYLRRSGAFTQLQQAYYVAGLSRRASARWAYLAFFLLHSLNDWNDFPLPDALFPLYYVMRPFTWLWRYFIQRQPDP